MRQEVLLAMLAKEPTHGYQLRARLRDALGPLGDAMNDGQVYVTLTRLEKAGLLAAEKTAESKVYTLTAAGHQRVAAWVAEVSCWDRGTSRCGPPARTCPAAGTRSSRRPT
ncbi:hypothetical protein GCM10009557_86150 [Virgisporangium ochraceum]